MPVELKCDYCGKKFEKKPGRVRENNFCSQKCYNQWRREDKKRNPNWKGGKVTKTCEECGEEFKIWPSREERRFCSEECKNKAHSEFMEGRRRNRKTVECDWCGKEFERIVSHIREHNFCSRECQGKYYSENRGGEDYWGYEGKQVTRECERCGGEFTIPEAWVRKDRGRFCSSECYHKWTKEEGIFKGENNPRWNRVKISCDNCGKELERTSFQINEHNHAFCSRKCCSEWREEKVEVECQNCGKTVEKVPSKAKRVEKHFCSNECRCEWSKGRNHPTWRGGYESYYGPNWQRQRRRTLERDNRTCQVCGIGEDGREHDVHHIVSFREFGLENHKEANSLENLITLCQSCHMLVERGGMEIEA